MSSVSAPKFEQSPREGNEFCPSFALKERCIKPECEKVHNLNEIIIGNYAKKNGYKIGEKEYKTGACTKENCSCNLRHAGREFVVRHDDKAMAFALYKILEGSQSREPEGKRNTNPLGKLYYLSKIFVRSHFSRKELKEWRSLRDDFPLRALVLEDHVGKEELSLSIFTKKCKEVYFSNAQQCRQAKRNKKSDALLHPLEKSLSSLSLSSSSSVSSASSSSSSSSSSSLPLPTALPVPATQLNTQQGYEICLYTANEQLCPDLAMCNKTHSFKQLKVNDYSKLPEPYKGRTCATKNCSCDLRHIGLEFVVRHATLELFVLYRRQENTRNTNPQGKLYYLSKAFVRESIDNRVLARLKDHKNDFPVRVLTCEDDIGVQELSFSRFKEKCKDAAYARYQMRNQAQEMTNSQVLSHQYASLFSSLTLPQPSPYPTLSSSSLPFSIQPLQYVQHPPIFVTPTAPRLPPPQTPFIVHCQLHQQMVYHLQPFQNPALSQFPQTASVSVSMKQEASTKGSNAENKRSTDTKNKETAQQDLQNIAAGWKDAEGLMKW